VAQPEENTLVRISVANVVECVQVQGTRDLIPIGILNKDRWNNDGVRRFQLLGGAVALTDRMVRQLEDHCQARGFSIDVDANVTDARFFVPERFVTRAMNMFMWYGSGLYESTPHREVTGELTNDGYKGIPAVFGEGLTILSDELRFARMVLQEPLRSGSGTSTREHTTIPTRRLFRSFLLRLPPSTVDTLLTSPLIHRFTDGELETTMGGTQMGTTGDGAEIADNIGMW